MTPKRGSKKQTKRRTGRGACRLSDEDRGNLLGWHHSSKSKEEIRPQAGDLDPWLLVCARELSLSGESKTDAERLMEEATKNWRCAFIEKRRRETAERLFFGSGSEIIDVHRFLRILLPQIDTRLERMRIACEVAANSALLAELSEHLGSPRAGDPFVADRVSILSEDIPKWQWWMKMDSGVMTRETAGDAAFLILLYTGYFNSPAFRGSKGYASKRGKGAR